jgi:small subunit ribosomal protein S2
MPTISMRQLLEAGVHFGHQTRRWNPKMKPFIFAERNGIHIIDLAQTVSLMEEALDFVSRTVADGDYILFVGTKKQAQEPVHDEATRSEMPYVNHRWLGGMLTNFVTIRKRVGLLDQLEARQASGDLERLSKKEASRLTDEMARLDLKLGGVRKMRRLPGAIFVVDPQREKIAVTEARRLEIPVIATGDTNVDPDQIDYIIPANDDAIRAIRLLCRLVADAAIEGMGQRAARAAEDAPMGADVSDADTASEEMLAAVSAGGTYSFAPEPDEDEAVLPGEGAVAADAAVASDAPAAASADASADAVAEAPAAAATGESAVEADGAATEVAAPTATEATAAPTATEATAAPSAEAEAAPAKKTTKAKTAAKPKAAKPKAAKPKAKKAAAPKDESADAPAAEADEKKDEAASDEATS